MGAFPQFYGFSSVAARFVNFFLSSPNKDRLDYSFPRIAINHFLYVLMSGGSVSGRSFFFRFPFGPRIGILLLFKMRPAPPPPFSPVDTHLPLSPKET